MPAPAWEDLDAFLTLDTSGGFASTATIALQGAGTISVRGIFDDPYLDAQLGEYHLDTSAPRFLCKSSEVGDVARGDTITIGATVYDITESPMHDGTGMATIKLRPL